VSGGGGASWFGIWRCRARACAGGREADRHPCLLLRAGRARAEPRAGAAHA
jgi:hypothetical protein